MSIQTHIEELNKMSAEDIAALEAIPADQIKEAQAKVDREFLADNLYQYGWLQAEREFATYEGEGDLSKVASADAISEHEAQETAARENIETLLGDLDVNEAEDEVELLKEAQAAAGFIFAGYTDALEKIAKAKPKAAKGFMAKVKSGMKGVSKKVSHGYESAKEMGEKGMKAAKKGAGKAGEFLKKHKEGAMKAIKKHPGKAGIAAGLGLAGGAYVAKKMHEKKASELTVAELHEEFAKIAEIDAGFDKLASYAAKKGEAAKALLE